MSQNDSGEPSLEQDREPTPSDDEVIRNIPLFFDFCEENPHLGDVLAIDSGMLNELLAGLANLMNDAE